VELITAVANYITSQADLCSLALASKQLNDVATPLLYRQISLGRARGSKPSDAQVQSPVVVLLEQPHLAAYVHHLNMYPLLGIRFAIEENSVLQDAIDKLRPKHKDKHIFSTRKAIGKRQKEALLTLLLQALPNLRSLKMGIHGFHQGEYHGWLSKQMTGPARRILQKLEHLGQSSASAPCP
jgi:hypothetical protein